MLGKISNSWFRSTLVSTKYVDTPSKKINTNEYCTVYTRKIVYCKLREISVEKKMTNLAKMQTSMYCAYIMSSVD